jgi:uncharacterized protein YbaP (TraB family)
MYLKRTLCVLIFTALSGIIVFGQKAKQPQYPSLLWEITGNGLTKPSYLFGTMHVSSKLVFHLSDSFYHALKSVDAVALELNPDTWQGQMVTMDKMKADYEKFTEVPPGSFLNENSFRLNKFDDELKAALSTEPTMVNSLLYRSYKAQEDFEENTFLDLYIFQTGKKLGKRATGVEDYYEAEKIMLEAYSDMAKEKNKKDMDTDGESPYSIMEKVQDAYRRGDLDLMDSLDLIMERSMAFREKFLYKRNEIQAKSIDTIVKKSSLFVGVGAAHLPGKRGVIELLRKMGYRLRPIKMTNRDAAQKEAIDKLKSPVKFSEKQSEDGFYSVATPGTLYNMNGEYQSFGRRQYSDMSNGSYYLVTRVKTYAAFLGKTEDEILKKIDSLLYENIPGKILTKKLLENNGYNGYDIVNKNRTGDVQRYNIFVTPSEVIVFKMGGKENYTKGPEADRFFSSIRLKAAGTQSVVFSPVHGGFSVTLPQQPVVYLNEGGADGMSRWEYTAKDKTTGDVYIIIKKSVQNFRFLEKDSFDLAMIEESFRSPDFFQRQLKRAYSVCNGYPCLDVKEKMKDSSEVTARYIIKGPHYYVLAVRSGGSKSSFSEFFNSFSLTPFRYAAGKQYVDTFMHFSVNTPVQLQMDESYRSLVEQAKNDIAGSDSYSAGYSYWKKINSGLFQHDSTGEQVGISVQEYPKYFFIKDSAAFWKAEVDEYYAKTDMTLYKKDKLQLPDGAAGYRIQLRDTGSSRNITRMVLVKGNYVYSMSTMGDTLNPPSSFISNFLATIRPEVKDTAKSLFANKLTDFFDDLFSKDSATHAQAQKAISNIYYGEKGATHIISALSRLKADDKDYYDTKTKLIAELGYIKDTANPIVVNYLGKLYAQTSDTSLFSKAIIQALSRHKTQASFKLMKELLLQDPPIFDNNYEYEGIFSNLEDTLQLARTLYPELLELTSLDDYKKNIISLLVTLVDSGYVTAKEYNSYFSKLYFDAKIELKKLRGRDEKRMEEESKKEDETRDVYTGYRRYDSDGGNLEDYAVLLMPFFEQQATVPEFFKRLLQSKDEDVRMTAAVLLLRNKKQVADSIILNLAKKDKLRARLYGLLEEAKQLDKFPAKYRNQPDMARACLLRGRYEDKIDSVVLLGKQTARGSDSSGTVYFFKYRIKKEDDWKIAMSGLQPTDSTKINTDNQLVSMSDKKLKEDEPLQEQFDKILKKELFGLFKSGVNFFGYGSGYRYNEPYYRPKQSYGN